MTTIKEEKARTIAVIRQEMAWWGHSVDHLTDEDVEQGVLKMGEALAHFGIPSHEAGHAFIGLSRVLRERESGS
jgi:hypothetical protein